MVDRGIPGPQLALVERWVDALRPISAVDVVWLESSLAADRANAASDVDVRMGIADDAYGQLWETDRTPLLAGLGEYLLLENTFVRALTSAGIIFELWAYRTSQLQDLELFEWKILLNRLPPGEPHFAQAASKPPAETWPEREPLSPEVVRRRMNFALVMMAEVPSCFYNHEPHALMLTLNIARDDLLQLMYRRIGLSYLKRAKHLSEILPAAWLEELEQTYPYPCAARLDQGAVVQALIETFRFQGYHLQALSEQAGGGFEPLWFWRLYEQMSQKLKAFI
ncbi:MAG: hypothetical protein DCC55_40955 [Chloroflexi bacterium]|nr:MAG: hypothetical protein DCC55_40955 [Chloroflexota bacterium]